MESGEGGAPRGRRGGARGAGGRGGGRRGRGSRRDRAGVRDEGLVARILAAVRTPDERLGDLEAQLAANYVGERALRRLVQREGAETVARYGRALLDYSQAFMGGAIRDIPDGEYAFEDALDGDGAGG